MPRKSSRRRRGGHSAQTPESSPVAPKRQTHRMPVVTTPPRPRGPVPWRVWLSAARPKTLPAALGPVLLGVSLAIRDGSFAFGPALAAALCALLLQVGSNYANDYFDHRRGADTPDRLGPTRAVAAGLIAPEHMRNAALGVLATATLIGAYLVWVGGWPILAAGLAALVAALTYTGGPLPYGYAGLGDLFVFMFFGLVAVNGTYYLQTGEITTLSILAGVCAGALVTAILVVNNLRDLETDRRAGKRTLAVLLGRRNTQIEYLALMLAAYLGVIVIWQLAGGSLFLLLPLLSMPLALRHIQEVWGETPGRKLNDTLVGTARLSLFFSLLLSAGFLM